MVLEQYLKAKAALLEEQLDQLTLDALSSDSNPLTKRLFLAVRYALLGGGKRLRPILALATCEALGGDEKAALIPACALEMIHTYSMIHDDLPCMDNDDFRRGKPSLHKAFSESIAILSGDYLLTYAFDLLSQAPYLTSQQLLSLVALLSKKSGKEGMLVGQIMDIEATHQKIDLDTLKIIHQYKTGALISSSVAFGAIVAGANDKEKQILVSFAETIGLAFQIVDDILDVTKSQEKHGHTLGSDSVNGKTTYVTLMGLEKAKASCKDLLDSALSTLSLLPLKSHRLAEIAQAFILLPLQN